MDGSIYLLGRPIYGTTNSDQNLKVYYPEIRFRIPAQFRDKLWSKVMCWLFLGYFDENSVFHQVPKEILFNFVHIMLTTVLSGK
jgi:hypothetical protein